MKPVDYRKAVESLLKKGFISSHTDHEKYFFHYQGKKTSLFAKISFGIKQLKQREMRGMARTLQLVGSELENLLNCPMTKSTFEEHTKKVLPNLFKIEDK